jgi:putative tryptophan/tyrosine transport system substrate-binding protein
VKRRKLIMMLSATALTWPLAVYAQQKAMPVIGLLSPFSRADTELWHEAFRQGLRDLGWIEGVNVRIEYRFADTRMERLTELVSDLIKLKVDVIVASITPDALVAAKATKTIPIVMVSPGDPIGTGLIASLSRPGGNVTGMSQMLIELVGKRPELLKEVAPSISRVAVLWNPQDAISILAWQELQAPARQLGIGLYSLEVQSGDQFEAAFGSVFGANVGAIMAMPSPIFVDNEKRIADFAAVNRLPSMFHLSEFVRVGGLLAYGVDRSYLFRRATSYVDKILKGANPADLPVEQPTKFELAINLNTAKSLGLTVPPLLLALATEVIE